MALKNEKFYAAARYIASSYGVSCTMIEDSLNTATKRYDTSKLSVSKLCEIWDRDCRSELEFQIADLGLAA
jgi:thiaminase